jgi:hypothetical protein
MAGMSFLLEWLRTLVNENLVCGLAEPGAQGRK